MTDSPTPAPLDAQALAALRVDYALSELDERFVEPAPLDQFGIWLAEARAAEQGGGMVPFGAERYLERDGRP